MADKTKPGAPRKGAYVWDLPTRLFHWAFLGAVATSLWTAEFGPMDIHLISGHVVLALLIFRIAWGVMGGRHARFASFVAGPARVIGYVKKLFSGGAGPHLGHNPMGGWSVVAMLLALAVQAGTGLFANDDILTEGPLAGTVTKSTSDFLTYIHHLSSNAVYALIALHLAAVAFYWIKGHGIVGAMITGRLRDIDADGAPPESEAEGSLTTAITIAAVAAGIAYAVMNY
ncbi:MAG: cytochrome b/b6 domain-containing protein [Rhodospirillales bacterium]